MYIAHVLNRGVEKRKVFLSDSDYVRFVHNLFVFNDKNRVNNNNYHIGKNKNIDIGCRYLRRERESLVNIHAFCLMPNHYHLLLSPVVENGISKFIQKINMGYAKHFNEKYERSGSLFQGKSKKIIIDNDAYFIHLPYYIHLNPLDVFAPEWRERRVNDLAQCVKQLESYRWSSHLDYLGKKNFPSVTDRRFLLEVFGGEGGYKKSIYDWLCDLSKINSLRKDVVLE